MVLEKVESSTLELSDFFDFLYENQKGYVYIALKNPGIQASWKQSFFQWPEQKQELVDKVVANREKFEVYFGPSLYRDKSADKGSILGASCAWVEFDGSLPSTNNGFPEPSLRIQSSSDLHQHWYWKLDHFQENVEQLEHINRTLAYNLGADVSGWDSTQVLRPPSSRNHKRNTDVQLLEFSPELVYGSESFSTLSQPPSVGITEIPVSIPPVEEVIAAYKFKAEVWILFNKGVPEGSRSEGLMALGYHLAEMQMKDGEILSLLLNADTRWGKFAGRNDQIRRLAQIVSIARNKYPLLDTDSSPVGKLLQGYGFTHLVLSEQDSVEWLWEGYLDQHGFMLLTGPSGIGKSQVSLDFGAKVVLGQPFLGSETSKSEEPKRIGFLSLEMGIVELKWFLNLQAQGYTQEQLNILNENYIMFPVGEPYYFAKESEREAIEEMVYENRLDGLIIDSLGSMADDLITEKEVKTVINFNDRLRQRHSIFTWIIHHHRKSSGDNKKPNKKDDVYGNQYITARPSSIVCLWETPNPNIIEVIPLKTRMMKRPPNFKIDRTENLSFELSKSDAPMIVKSSTDMPKGLEI